MIGSTSDLERRTVEIAKASYEVGMQALTHVAVDRGLAILRAEHQVNQKARKRLCHAASYALTGLRVQQTSHPGRCPGLLSLTPSG